METTPREQLQEYRLGRGLSTRAAAGELGVTRTAFSNWENGRAVPTAPWRDAIERWSNGVVKSSSWPLSDRERRVVAAAGRVHGPPVGVAPVNTAFDERSRTLETRARELQVAARAGCDVRTARLALAKGADAIRLIVLRERLRTVLRELGVLHPRKALNRSDAQ